MKLLGIGNPKTAKGEAAGWLTGIMHLAPAKLSGYNVCPMASKGCEAACLNTAGRGRMSKIQDARVRKTVRYFEDRDAFMADLRKDIKALERKAGREGLRPAVRLNGTSDIPWERVAPDLFRDFPDVQFYDYTKRPGRDDLPDNYHLTFSRSESNEEHVATELAAGRNVAVVLSDREALEAYADIMGAEHVTDGDANDLRFLDPPGGIVALKAKGDAKRDDSGFVIGGCA